MSSLCFYLQVRQPCPPAAGQTLPNQEGIYARATHPLGIRRTANTRLSHKEHG